MYGTEKFASLWRTQKLADVKALWASELGKFGRAELANAVSEMMVKHPSWPPTLPEFVALCRPAALDPEAAFHEALVGTYARRDGKFGEWSHRAIYHASVDVSAFDMLNSTWPQIKTRWTRALNARLADPNLPEIPDVPKRLPEPERIKPGDSPIVDELVAKLTGTKRDYRGWVKKILERHAASDKTLTDYAYRMALNAENVRS